MKLPLNCEAEYHEGFLDLQEANALFSQLSQILEEIAFQPETIDGRKYEVNFGKIMFIDEELMEKKAFPEQFWGPTKVWFAELRKLKEKIEEETGHTFQVCVLIHYPDGHSGVDFHSDYSAYGDTSLIPSISLGEEREFQLREKASGDIFSQTLANGSLIVMGEHCQERYEHSLPVNPAYKNPRINLTFRKYGFEH